MPRQGHNTPLPLKRSPPVSFKRMLDGALFTDARARRAPRAAQSPRRPWIGKLLWATTHYGDVRGAAGLCRAVGVVERGEQILPRAPRRSAPRALTVPKELTKGCLWGGSAPPNGSRLSCGRLARRRKSSGRTSRARQGTTQRLPLKRERPPASSAC